MRLESCPCCLGKAGLTDMMVGNMKMWQIGCTECGVSTELDEDKKFCARQWNRRLEVSRLKMWVTGLASMLPFVAIMAFLLGSFLGLNLFPGQ